YYVYVCLFFFFSSRRRHTRFDCDWSSDVCSSDLYIGNAFAGHTAGHANAFPIYLKRIDMPERWTPDSWRKRPIEQAPPYPDPQRSEERRVGKEGRSRGTPVREDKISKAGDVPTCG